LTEDHAVTERRCRRRTLEELIYLALVKYPRYVDIESGEFVSAEQMVSAIQRQKEQALSNNENSWRGRQLVGLQLPRSILTAVIDSFTDVQAR